MRAQTFFSRIAILLLPALSAACVSSSGGTTAATTAATAPTVTASTSGTAPRFPETISGGDGFQVNPTNDASFATLINSVRASVGSAPVAYNAQLETAAQSHATDMFANGYFSHFGLNGSSVGQRVTAAGYTWRAVAENIAQGQTNENQAMNGWTDSAGHHANNINPAFTEFGLGRAGSGSQTRWVLVLAAPQ